MTDTTPDSARTRRDATPLRLARRALVLLVGIPIALLGMIGLIAPGVPGIPLMIAGLAVLAIEFDWAQRRVEGLRATARRMLARERDPAGR